MTEEQLKEVYEKVQKRSRFNTSSNNWLKLHGIPMRRKPFKKQWPIVDEMYKLVNPETGRSFCKCVLAGVKKYQI